MGIENQQLSDKHRQFFDSETLHHDLKKKSIRGGTYTFIGSGLDFVLRLGSVAVLARILIPEHFGLISMVTAITVIAERFKDLGLSLATVQQKEITHEQVSTLFWINFLIGLTITLCLCAFSKLVGWFYSDGRVIWITIAIGTTFFWGGLTVQHQALLWRRMEYLKISLVNLAANICSILVAIVLAVKGYGYWALVWREVSRSIFTAIAFWILCPWVPAFPNRNTGIGRMVRFGRDVAAFNFVTYFTDNLDQILLGKLYGPSLLGVYRQAYQLVLTPISQLTNPISFVAQSTLSVLQNDTHQYRNYYRKMLTASTFLTMPIAGFLFVYSRHIILFVLGEKWIGAEVIFRIFALAAFIRPAVSTTGLVMLTSGKSKRYLYLGLANSILIIIALVIGLRWGAVGVAAGHVMENYLALFPVLFIAFRGTPVGIELFFRSILPAAICTLLMVVVLLGFSRLIPMQSSFSAIAAGLPVATSVYLLAWVAMPGGWMRLKGFFSDFSSVFRKGERGQALSPT